MMHGNKTGNGVSFMSMVKHSDSYVEMTANMTDSKHNKHQIKMQMNYSFNRLVELSVAPMPYP